MGEKLRRIRLQKRLTREKLARKAGVLASSIARMEERSGGAATAETLRKVASTLGKTVEEIFLL